MLAENQDYSQDNLYKTDGSFQRQKYSLNTTEIHSTYEKSTTKIDQNKYDSQPTLPELPYSSRAFDFEQIDAPTALQMQTNELIQRFSGIHKMLIHHSQYESCRHQKKRGFKIMSIDQTELLPNYSNKAIIISDLVSLVQELQAVNEPNKMQQLLDTKFLQYYLQRHYGSLKCQSNNLNLSIQEKLQSNQDQENRQYIVSKLQGCDTVRDQSNSSNILISEEGEDKQKEISVIVEKIKIIQVEIPVVVYKLKEVVVRYEESDLNFQINNIDSIINRYSKTYEENYKNSKQNAQKQIQQQLNYQEIIQKITPLQSSMLTSMINSNHASFKPKQTEIELIYSDFPEENNFKLPLDSFAQLESLISNQSGSSTGRLSRPPTQRDNLIPINEQAIMITEKGASRSLLQRIQQSQRILNEQNHQLKQSIAFLQQRLTQLQIRNRDLEIYNKKIASRLEDQIQQTQYFSAKLDQINAEILQQKVQCLTHLNYTQQRKIQALMIQLNESNNKIDALTRQFEQIETILHSNEKELKQRDQEILLLSKQLQQKEQQMQQIQNCENNVIELATSSQENLRKQIQRLQSQKSQFQEQIKQYRKRLKIQGINLEYDQAAQIKGIIQSREHTYNLRLLDVNKRYEEVMSLYQQQLKELKGQLQQLNQINQKKSELLASKQAKYLLTKIKNQQYFKEFENIIKEYDRQLEQKDQQIISLKLKSNQEQDVQMVLEKFVQTINLLQNQLLRQRSQKAKITSKFIELDEIVRKELENQKNNKKDFESQEKLIEQLSTQLEKKMSQNKIIKKKLEDQSALLFNFIQNQGKSESNKSIKQENDKLRSINKKLKQYTLLLQKQIKAVCSIDECESHRSLITNLFEQKNYLCDLLTKDQTYGKICI